MSRRTIPQAGANMDKKIERLNRISMEAAKQSGRGIVPLITKPVSMTEMLKMFKVAKDREYGEYRAFVAGIVPWEEERRCKLSDAVKTVHSSGAKEIWVFIGPEGGITEEEAGCAQKVGMLTVTLGQRILRTETAGLAVLSSVMYEYGEY